jgi:hypothetical protein
MVFLLMVNYFLVILAVSQPMAAVPIMFVEGQLLDTIQRESWECKTTCTWKIQFTMITIIQILLQRVTEYYSKL